MKLKELVEKAETGHSNTMYKNIDHEDDHYVVFQLVNRSKHVIKKFEKLEEAIKQINEWNKNGWPILDFKQDNKRNRKHDFINKLNKLPVKKIKAKTKRKVVKKMTNYYKKKESSNKMRFKSDKYKDRKDIIEYDPTMVYRPNKQ